jgi:hypothetical protein
MILLLLGATLFLLHGSALEVASPFSMLDFKAVYYGSRCLVQHGDPYKAIEVLRVYRADTVKLPADPKRDFLFKQIASECINPPTTLFFLTPVAVLPFGPAHILWIALTAGGLILAGILIWDAGAGFAPLLSGVLIGFLLANSEIVFMVGNTAGIVISLCVVASWCFLKDRFVPAGILCLAVSLAIKPHDAGLVWLYFLLAGSLYRKRALQTLLVTAVLSVPAILWISMATPNWMRELHSNLLTSSAPGSINDPALATTGQYALNMVISLQSAISVFRDDPRFYNSVSYLLCAPLLLAWGFITLRFRSSPARAWLALAAIAALTMLPTYHRSHDAKLLLLTVPACAMLWAEGGRIARFALLINTAAFVLTGDIPWMLLTGLIDKLHIPATGVSEQILTAIWVFPTPLTLLVMSVFYLWMYARRCSAIPLAAAATEPAGELNIQRGITHTPVP